LKRFAGVLLLALKRSPVNALQLQAPATYLLQEGFVARTARGRVATARAYSHLGGTRRRTLL
jgi:Holliday junction resolvasome RuvABC ATP-dependent DNA helicase subunit